MTHTISIAHGNSDVIQPAIFFWGKFRLVFVRFFCVLCIFSSLSLLLSLSVASEQNKKIINTHLAIIFLHCFTLRRHPT